MSYAFLTPYFRIGVKYNLSDVRKRINNFWNRRA